MQKTILAVALASAFSMGTACSADTKSKFFKVRVSTRSSKASTSSAVTTRSTA